MSGELSRFWVHSFEEDARGEKVFRPKGYALPLARGRETLDLRHETSIGMVAPGPDDRPRPKSSGWRSDGSRLSFTGSDEVYDIVELSDDRLILKKVVP
jgi:hypothetical protein